MMMSEKDVASGSASLLSHTSKVSSPLFVSITCASVIEMLSMQPRKIYSSTKGGVALLVALASSGIVCATCFNT